MTCIFTKITRTNALEFITSDETPLAFTLAVVLLGGSQKHVHMHSCVAGFTTPGNPVSTHVQQGSRLALQTLWEYFLCCIHHVLRRMV